MEIYFMLNTVYLIIFNGLVFYYKFEKYLKIFHKNHVNKIKYRIFI